MGRPDILGFFPRDFARENWIQISDHSHMYRDTPPYPPHPYPPPPIKISAIV